MPEPSNLNAEIAAKVLEANVRNIVEKVKAGGTLNASERAIMESAATKKPETPLQESEASAAAAPFLFLESELGFEKLEATGEFTGERLLQRRPEVYRAVVRMAAEGQSISATARALMVSRNTVAAVREREGISIEQEKKELLRDVRRAARMSVERAIELVPSINSAKDAAIVAAVMVDKMQLLSGEATSRIERVDTDQDKLKEMLAALPVLDAEVIPQTGLSGSAPGQKAPAPAPDPSALALVECASYTDNKYISTKHEAPSLSETPMQDCKPLEINESKLPTMSIIGSYQSGNDSQIADQGGEGVAIFEGGLSDSIHPSSPEILAKGTPPAAPPASSNPNPAP